MVFAHATVAPEPMSRRVQQIAWVYAAVLVVMAVAQLYTFEDFIPLIEGYGLLGGHAVAVLVAGLIVIYEIFALPYLLRMTISPLLRIVGCIFSLLLPAVWFGLAVYAGISGLAITNGAMLGEKVSVPIPIQLLVSLILLVMATYIAKGFLPTLRKK